MVHVEEDFNDLVDLQQRGKFSKGDANNVGYFLDVNFIVEELRGFNSDIGFLLILLDYLRLNEEKLGKNDSNFSGCVGAFKSENYTVGEAVVLC